MARKFALLFILFAAALHAKDTLIFGFERPEITTLQARLTGSTLAYDSLRGSMLLTRARHTPWLLLAGNSSEGQFAMSLARVPTLAEDPLDTYNSFRPIPYPDAEPWQYYGMFHNGKRFFNTVGKFSLFLPKDWSAWDVLRIDVRAKDVTQVIQVLLEDEVIAPMALRTFTVNPGEWSTLEYDLRQAALERRLDLKKMVGLYVAVREAPGKAINDSCCLIDNIRLATAGTANTLPVIRDLSSMALPPYYRHTTSPAPETMPKSPNRAPLAGVDAPRIIATDTALAFNIPGFISAFDNDNLIAGYIKETMSSGLPVLTMKSSDGGTTWTGLDGGAKATRVPGDDPREGNGRGEVVGTRGDVVMLAVNCTEDNPGLKEHAYVWSFNGTNWDRTCKLMDCDPRHCPSHHTAAKSADGRLWTGYSLASRLQTTAVNVHFSDDNGLSWKPSREGTAGLVPGTLKQPGTSYGSDFTALVPWGNSGVACLTLVRTATRPYPLIWTRFEGGNWTAPETIPVPRTSWTSSTYYSSAHPGIKAVSLNGNEVFAVCAFTYGVYHYKDGAWTHEARDIPMNSQLCVAGGKTVVAVGTPDTGLISAGKPRVPTRLLAWKYRQGAWIGPDTVVKDTEGFPLSMYGPPYVAGFYIPAASPPNFIPLAWVTSRVNAVNSVKFVRIPLPIDPGLGTLQGPASTPLKVTLTVLPNPFLRTVAIRFAGDAQAAIYDVSGRLVWQTGFSSGNPRRLWDSRTEARGIYILKLFQSGRQVQSLKLIKL